jgi:hypothetical protein
MPHETQVTIRYEARSLYNALTHQQRGWTLADHEFDITSDEVKVSVDPGGSARIAVTINFELDREAFDELLHRAVPAE